MATRKVSQQEVLDYLVRQEKLHFDEYGKKGIFPTTLQVMMVFDISKDTANRYINEIEERYSKIYRLKPVNKMGKVIKIRK